MDQANLTDSLLFLWSVLCGFLFGLYYECFRFIRLGFRHGVWLCAAEDLLFCLPAAFIYILFTFAFSDGVVRLFSLAGTGIGFVFYLLSLGRFFVRISDRAWRAVRAVTAWILRYLILPPARRVTRLFSRWKKGARRRKAAKKEARRVRCLTRRKERFNQAAARGFGLSR